MSMGQQRGNMKYRLYILISVAILFIGTLIQPVLENTQLSYIRNLGRHVVMLTTLEGGGGTGFVVKGKSGTAYILTNNHICEAATRGILVLHYRDIQSLIAVYRVYPKNDLCVLLAPKYVDGYLKIASDVSLGERAYSIGHPLLEELTVSQGELSTYTTIPIIIGLFPPEGSCRAETYSIEQLQTFFGPVPACVRSLNCVSSTIPILPGNSGSPTVNIWGHVIGVVFAANESGVHSYHVPLSAIKDFLGGL